MSFVPLFIALIACGKGKEKRDDKTALNTCHSLARFLYQLESAF